MQFGLRFTQPTASESRPTETPGAKNNNNSNNIPPFSAKLKMPISFWTETALKIGYQKRAKNNLGNFLLFTDTCALSRDYQDCFGSAAQLRGTTQ